MGPSCQRCIYRQPDERPDYSTSGFCHRFPHTVSVVATLDGGVNFENHRPWVTPDDWCGEFKATPSILSDKSSRSLAKEDGRP